MGDRSRPGGPVDLGYGDQRYAAFALAQGERLEALRRAAVRLAQAHADVVFLVLEAPGRCFGTLYRRAHDIADAAGAEPELRGALAVDVDVDLRPAHLQAVGYVDETFDLPRIDGLCDLSV